MPGKSLEVLHSHQLRTNSVPTPYQLRTNSIPTPYQLPPTPYQLRTNSHQLPPTPYQLPPTPTNSVPTPYQLPPTPTNSVPTYSHSEHNYTPPTRIIMLSCPFLVLVLSCPGLSCPVLSWPCPVLACPGFAPGLDIYPGDHCRYHMQSLCHMTNAIIDPKIDILIIFFTVLFWHNACMMQSSCQVSPGGGQKMISREGVAPHAHTFFYVLGQICSISLFGCYNCL